MKRRWTSTAGIALNALLIGLPAGAQGERAGEQIPTCASLAGTVFDAQRMRPLIGATVSVSRVDADSATAAVECVSREASARTMVTGDPGRYRFDALAPGQYAVRVQRLGYKPAEMQVTLRSLPDAKVSVGLTELPVMLHSLPVRVSPSDSYGRRESIGRSANTARLAAAMERGETQLSADTREVTHGDVVQGVTLVESDLFRAVQRLAGVTARDEYSGELWARGGRADATRVLFDGLPVFGSAHAFGSFSAINPDAVGSAILHLGVRPASIAEGGSAVLDLRPRSAARDGQLRGVGEVSLLRARLALDQSSRDGRTGWMLAGRRSYFDVATWALERAGIDGVYTPYHFGDVTARVDHRVGAAQLEATAFYTTDQVGGDVRQVVQSNRTGRSNAIARVGVRGAWLGLDTRVSAGVSDFSSDIRRVALSGSDEFIGVRTEAPASSGMRYLQVGAESKLESALWSTRWSLGAELVAQRATFTGGVRRTFGAALSLEQDTIDTESSYGTLWGEWRAQPVRALELGLGARADFGSAIANAGRTRVAPRAHARLRLGEGTELSLGFGRSYQYAQGIPPASTGRQGVLYPTELWVVANDTTPALRSDITSLGFSHRWGTDSVGWIVTAAAYRRRSTGNLLGDPTPGTRRAESFVATGIDRARGWELGLRHIAERWSAELAYSATSVETSANGLTFPSPYHRPRVLDATFRRRLTRTVTAAAAFTAGSGVAYTRVTPPSTRVTQEGEPVWVNAPVAEAPGAHRSGATRNLDLALEWARKFGRFDVTMVGQVHNVLGVQTSGIYRGYVCKRVASGTIDTPDLCERYGDRFDRGLPTFPSFVMRVGF